MTYFDEPTPLRTENRRAMSNARILALSGGVGGAKLGLGLANILAAGELLVVANTADDFKHLGLSISPDLDTLMYTLAGINDTQRGWGLAGESWKTMEALAAIGGETWFQLGDRDLATHLERTRRLSRGDSLTAVTGALCEHFGVQHRIVPMTDDPVRTVVGVSSDSHDQDQTRLLSFQEYFVREQCQPKISKLYFERIDRARPQPQMLRLLDDPNLEAVVICPSNPFLSIDPILHLPEVRHRLRQTRAPVVAVSPIVAGDAIKGPTAKMMRELDMPVTATAVASYYSDFLDGFVLHTSDSDLRSDIEDLGVTVCCTNTVMDTLQDRTMLAENVLKFCQTLVKGDSPASLAAN